MNNMEFLVLAAIDGLKVRVYSRSSCACPCGLVLNVIAAHMTSCRRYNFHHEEYFWSMEDASLFGLPPEDSELEVLFWEFLS